MSLAFGFALPHWQAISGGAFSPASLFAGGTVAGAWYDPSDLTTLFTTSAGTTPVVMPGLGAAVPVGAMLDKSQGLVLGPELIANGNFNSGGTGWTQISGTFTFSNGRAIAANVDSIKRLSSTASSMVAGRWYVITWNQYAGAGTGAANWTVPGVWNGSDNFANGGAYVNGEGPKTLYYLAPVSGQFYLYNFEQEVEYDNISVRELPGNHAIAFNDTTARPELRARVNLLTYSEEFDNGAWVKVNATVSANAGVAPDGTNTADLVYPSSSGSYHGSVYQTGKTGNRLSVCAKASGLNWLYFVNTGGAAGVVWFDVANGVTGTVGAGYTASITSLGNGWYRCTVEAASGNFLSPQFGPSNSDNTVLATASGTNGLLFWGADLRPANIGANVPAYQRIADANTYDTSGFPLYLFFDGIDDSVYTPANLNLSGTDKVAVFAGVRKLVDAALQIIAETSSVVDTNNGALAIGNSIGGAQRWLSALRGTSLAYYEPATYEAPITNVLSTSFDIAGVAISSEIVPRINGVIDQDNPAGASAGTGNFGTYPLYIGARNNSSLWLNGQVYGLLVVGSAVSAGNISATEQWVAGKTGIVIP